MDALPDIPAVRSRTLLDHQHCIRPLRRDDREPLRRLLMETQVFTLDEVDIALELIDTVLNRPDEKDYIIWTYEDAGEVLGYYCIGPTPGTDGTFDLYWVAVHPSVHGSGVGGALDRHAEQLIRSLGGRLVIAETSSGPQYDGTRRFYLRHGYTEVARIPEYYRPGDGLVVYGKYLHLS
jgi:GNAT superfamily N-acetyltransferase